MVSTGTPWVMPEDIPALIAEGTNAFAINRPGSLACHCVQRSPPLEPQPTAGDAQPTTGAAAHGWSRAAHHWGRSPRLEQKRSCARLKSHFFSSSGPEAL